MQNILPSWKEAALMDEKQMRGGLRLAVLDLLGGQVRMKPRSKLINTLSMNH